MPTRKPLSREAIKLLAMAAMACNHAAQALLPAGTPAREALVDIGYFTAVTMCYFLVEGYRYTRSRRRYALRLALCGVVSQLVYWLALGVDQANMMFTLFFCFLLLWALDRLQGHRLRLPVVAALVLVTAWCDWPILAAGFTLLFALCGQLGRGWTALCFAMAAVLFFAFNYSNYSYAGWAAGPAALHAGLSCLGILAAGAVILLGYSGRRSAFALAHPALAKYGFYLFYPGHLAVIAALRVLLPGT